MSGPDRKRPGDPKRAPGVERPPAPQVPLGGPEAAGPDAPLDPGPRPGPGHRADPGQGARRGLWEDGTGPAHERATARLRRVVEALPGWSPLPPGEPTPPAPRAG
jgi:hypothetical protein